MIEILHTLGLAEAIKLRMGGISVVVDGEQAPLDQVRLHWTPQPDRKMGLPYGKVEIVVGRHR